MRHWPYRKSLLPEGRGVAPQWPWPACLESSLSILQFALLHWLIGSPQITMLSQLSSFIHVALQELFSWQTLIILGQGPGIVRHWGGARCWKTLRNCGYFLVTCFLRMLWSASTAAEVAMVCGLQIIKLPFISHNHILSQCKSAGQGNHPVQRDRKCYSLSHCLWQALASGY